MRAWQLWCLVAVWRLVSTPMGGLRYSSVCPFAVRPRGLRAPYSRGTARFPTTDSRSKRPKFVLLRGLLQQACRALLSDMYSFDVTYYINRVCVEPHHLNVELLAAHNILIVCALTVRLEHTRFFGEGGRSYGRCPARVFLDFPLIAGRRQRWDKRTVPPVPRKQLSVT